MLDKRNAAAPPLNSNKRGIPGRHPAGAEAKPELPEGQTNQDEAQETVQPASEGPVEPSGGGVEKIT